MQQLPKALGRSEGRTAGFSDELNEAIEALGCSASELAARAGLSKSTLSRYRSGARTPAADDESVKALVCAMAGLAAERGIAGLDAESLSSRFVSALTDANPCFDHELLRDRFAALVDALELSAASLAPALNYDPSTISRILAGRRRTGDPGPS